MANNVLPLIRLTEQFEKLPGVGRKLAQKLAFHVLAYSDEQAQAFADAILDAHSKIHRCEVCMNFTDREICGICSDPGRDHSVICVVEDPKDVMALERTHEFNGTYHVLHGLISPVNGIGPDQLHITELVARAQEGVTEVIMATNPTVEGETTAMYISRLLKPFSVTVTRLAYGIPIGGNLEYADDITLRSALNGRREI
ncbi:MAG: recombination protein RecR [Ruminococcaceae bacterium]|nr:recombination protein RecR [Oscillospiraceae bacterium]